MPERKQQVTSLTLDHLVRRRGMPLVKKNTYGLLWCIAGSSLSLAFAFFVHGSFDEVGAALIAGAIYGFFPLGVLFIMCLVGRQFLPAMYICLGLQALASIVVTLFIPPWSSPFEIIIYAGCGFGLGLIIVRIWGPREMVYRYARCPGCKYNLALLPKSDVCPECGRDNTDLVKMFADVEINEKTRPSAGVLDLDDLN